MLYENASLEPGVQGEHDVAPSSLLIETNALSQDDRFRFGMMIQHVGSRDIALTWPAGRLKHPKVSWHQCKV